MQFAPRCCPRTCCAALPGFSRPVTQPRFGGVFIWCVRHRA
nr:MAG TPA: hypothetical protein [Caudoviricetes sp.]